MPLRRSTPSQQLQKDRHHRPRTREVLDRHCRTAGDTTPIQWQPQGTGLHILLAGKATRGTKTAWCRFCSEDFFTVCN